MIVAALEKSRRKLNFKLCGYVLMPDHWHALIGVQPPLTISRAVQDVKWISAGWLNRRRKTAGPVWQRQFWDRFVRHQRGLAERLEYIHLNPVKKRLVGRPEDWKWSSYNNYSLGARGVVKCPIAMDEI